MADINPVVIAGSIDDSKLMEAIDKLVSEVTTKVEGMATGFEGAIGRMNTAMANFATQQAQAALSTKQSWQDVVTTFEQLRRTQEQQTRQSGRSRTSGTRSRGGSGGSSGGFSEGEDITVNDLEQLIRLHQRLRKEMKLESDELREQNKLLDEFKTRLKQETRPRYTLKEVLGMSDRTVDDITRKMRMLKQIEVDPSDTQQVKEISKAYTELALKKNKILGLNTEMTRSSKALASAFNYLRNRILFAFTIGSMTGFVRDLIKVRSEYEILERSIGILVGNMRQGTEIFKELNEMALKSPFTLMELGTAAKQLTAYNFAADEVVDTTRRLADISAALGVPMERLVYNLGQIKAQNILNARDARDFANAGLAIVPMLAKMYTNQKKFGNEIVTTSRVYDMMKKKLVSYTDVMSVIMEATDESGKFFDFQAKQAETLKVQLANLTLAWNNTLNEIGQSNQEVLGFPIKVLKEILKEWKQIDIVLKAVAITYGITLLSSMMGINKAMLGQQTIINAVKSAWIGLQEAAMSTQNWLSASIALVGVAVVGSILEYREAQKKIEEFNKAVQDAARDSSKAISDFMNSGDKALTKLRAKQKSLSLEEATNEWEALRSLIESSSANSDVLISKLSSIVDLNERVAASFEVADKIKIANDLLSEMGRRLQFTTDTWGGFLGEGIAEDLEDLAEAIERYGGYRTTRISVPYSQGRKWEDSLFTAIQTDLDEAKKEVENFAVGAKSLLRNELDDAINDPVMVSEGVRMIMREFEKANPKIRDAGKDFFEAFFAQLMSEEFSAFDQLDIQYNRLLDKIAHDSSSKFQNINDSILEEGQELTEAQLEAVNSAMDKLKETLPPEMQDLIDKLQKELDRNPLEFKIRLLGKFGKEVRDEWQRDFDDTFLSGNKVDRLSIINDETKKKIKEVSHDYVTYAQLRKKGDEDIYSWGARVLELEKDTETKIKETNSALKARQNLGIENDPVLTNLQKQSKELDNLKKATQEVKDRYGFIDPKAKDKGGSKKDTLGEAIANEVQLITDMQKRYNEYRKMGVSDTKAQIMAQEEYGKSLAYNNLTLLKFGITTKKNDELMVADLRGLKEYFSYLLESANALGNTKGVEALEKAIAKLNVEIAKVDMKKITDGLNNELSKAKDEYELAVELDATEGLGDALMDMLNIDASDFPQTIEQYMDRVNRAFDEFRLKTHTWVSPMDIFKMSEDDLKAWGKAMGRDDEFIKTITNMQKGAKDVVDKWIKDTIKENNTMENEMATNAEKIAKKEKEINDLRAKLSGKSVGIEKANLELRIRQEEEALEKLRSDILMSVPAYKALFGSIAEHSASMTHQLTDYLIYVFDKAKELGDEATGYTLLFGDGIEVKLNKKEFQREYEKITKEAKKAQSPFAKMKEAFSPDKDGFIDYAKGLEYVSQEIKKLGDLVGTIGNIANELGFSEATVEVINDISQSLSGMSQISDGITAIMNKDYIAGISGVANGLITALSGWLDNGDKKITRQIKESELAVKRLELAYKDLEKAVNDAIGTAVVGAEKAALANKTLQLAEIEHQLELEKSRSGKKRDEERIIALTGQAKDLRNEIEDGYKGITNNLLGISSVASAVESMVSGVVNALRQGENAIDVWNTSIDDMIVNMITKFVSAKVVAPMFQSVLDDITDEVAKRGEASNLEAQSLKQDRDQLNAQLEKFTNLKKRFGYDWYDESIAKLESQVAELDKQILDAETKAKQQSEFTAQDLDYMIRELMALKGQGQLTVDTVQAALTKYGLGSSSSTKQLSNLQQGIQGITETTAGALEAYANDALQQMYVQVGLQTQMLAQLQASVQIQQTIANMIQNMRTSDEMALRVQMVA